MSSSTRVILILDCVKLLTLIVILGILFMGEWYNGDVTDLIGFQPLHHFHDALLVIFGLAFFWGIIYLVEHVWFYD